MEEIAAYLKRDTVDSDAATVMSLNPDKFANEAAVPRYLYTSLKTLMKCTTNQIFYDKVLAYSGVGKEPSQYFIKIQPYRQESAKDYNGYLENVEGAESTLFRVYFRNFTTVGISEQNLVGEIDMRIRCLLDHTYRWKCGQSINIPFDIDNWPSTSLDPDEETNRSFYVCQWLKTEGNENASEIVSLYHANPKRTVCIVPNIPS